MTGRHEASYDTGLSCGHVVTYPGPGPRVGDAVWCARCDADRSVTAVRMYLPRVRRTGEVMTEDDRSARIDAEVQAIRAEYAEEAEAAEAEVAERNAALDVPLNLRIDRELDTQLKRRAAAAQIPTSALVRRLLRRAVHDPDTPVLTVEQVEAIARRVLADAE